MTVAAGGVFRFVVAHYGDGEGNGTPDPQPAYTLEIFVNNVLVQTHTGRLTEAYEDYDDCDDDDDTCDLGQGAFSPVYTLTVTEDLTCTQA